MNAIWTYEDGHLAARNENGDLIRRSVDKDMGSGLAWLLSQAGDLSRLLLWPHLEEQQPQT